MRKWKKRRQVELYSTLWDLANEVYAFNEGNQIIYTSFPQCERSDSRLAGGPSQKSPLLFNLIHLLLSPVFSFSLLPLPNNQTKKFFGRFFFSKKNSSSFFPLFSPRPPKFQSWISRSFRSNVFFSLRLWASHLSDFTFIFSHLIPNEKCCVFIFNQESLTRPLT